MQKNLVIVESPAKAKTLEKFLGTDYKVMSSYGHIRDLKSKEMSVDLSDFSPVYEIPSDKSRLVSELKKNAKEAETVWLASDEDREGEAISWHLSQVLGLDPKVAKRIVFHEITKTAILEAIKHPRTIDMGLVNAQQARRVLDRVVGFKLSPVLWRKLKPSLSAGRVQSVAVRLIVEREREIENFQSESSYRVNAMFSVDGQQLKATLNHAFKTEEEARAFLESCEDCTFKVTDIEKKPVKKFPAPPFTTSTLQQEAARKLGFTVSQTMIVAQRLYENGHITYMRTDSVNLSSLCINTAKDEIVQMHGDKYSHPRNFHTSSKGAQEAHEAIRPTYISQHEIAGSSQERRLYDLIWKRTVACQMAEAEAEKTTITITPSNAKNGMVFTASGEVITFDGFLRVYRESFDDDNIASDDEDGVILPVVKKGANMTVEEITSTERFSQHPLRYTEASLVKKMEELGIGRPSTYAPTISTIQQRNYVEKGDKKGEKRKYNILTLTADNKQAGEFVIKSAQKTEVFGNEKGKLLPTDIGIIVNDFLTEFFPSIVDYNFTARVEKDFDEIAEGREDWKKVMTDFYKDFEPTIENAMQQHSEYKVGERVLGTDPKSGYTVTVKIGRYGPMVQIGSASETEHPRFAQLKKEQSIQTLTLDEALELFRLPRILGEFEGSEVLIGAGRYGAYVSHAKKYVSIPSEIDPLQITLDEAISLINAQREAEKSNHLKAFEEDPDLEVMNGRFGPYIKYKGANYKIPRTVKDPTSLTYAQCKEIIDAQGETPTKRPSHRSRKS